MKLEAREEGLEEGREEGREEGSRLRAMAVAKELLDVLDVGMIAEKVGLPLEVVEEIKREADKENEVW